MYQSKTFTLCPINRDAIPQGQLNIQYKTRSNPLKWKGQFSPQLIETLLTHYGHAGATVFDPFMGSGTVLVESARQGYAAFATEINPAAYSLSQLYRFATDSAVQRDRALEQVTSILNRVFAVQLLIPHEKHTGASYVKAQLREAFTLATSPTDQILLDALVVLLDFYQPNLSEKKLFKVWQKIHELVISLPYSTQPINLFWADARATPLSNQTVDLVLTSPPYINVFNYHQQYRASMEYLHYDLLSVAKSEIGANRKHRGNRFLTVIQYILDMALVLQEMLRVCRKDAHMVFVVGRESKVRGVPFYNSQLVADIAHDVLGIALKTRHERHFKNRFGQVIYEDVLRFSCEAAIPHPIANLDRARIVAAVALNAAHTTPQLSGDVHADIDEALDKLDDVAPSPILNPNTQGETII